ncbi:MAG: toprim domain-containing protein [Clostridiales Family XIII bacterium]|jgi:hypothetical protein|nr:toprim domain-containing protein [Clostridiales Family XIII bacterium]
MPGVSREQIKRAKAISIEDYVLAREPGNIRRVGSAYYLKDHESLEISNGLWNWHSRGIGGKNVIDYLIKVRGFGFANAVRHLASEDHRSAKIIAPKAGAPGAVKPKENGPLKLPPRNRDNERVIAYLEGRGIDKALILECIARGLLYESAQWHNCVFIGRSDDGKARFAALRGTSGDFKRDADGSDKRFGFTLPPKNPAAQAAAIFESPIDALSHASLEPEFDGWRLSLSGAAITALSNFLERRGAVKTVIVCTDNDETGNLTAAKIAELSGISAARLLPPGGHKDWNEALQSNREEVKTNREEVKEMEDIRKSIRFIDSNHKTLFTVKDGDSVKFTSGYDGRVESLKCRFLDEVHITLIGKYHNDYHICQLAELMEANGSKCEPIPGQKPSIDILAARYGEKLEDAVIPMTESAIRKIVGGKYDVEALYIDGQGVNGEYGKQVHGAIVRGKGGIVVCGFDGHTFTSLHPYWARKYKRELSPAEPPRKPSLAETLEKAKEEAGARNAANRAGRERTGEPCL